MLHVRNASAVFARRLKSVNCATWRRSLLTLAIETSCDDTCVAILEKESKLATADHAKINGSPKYAQLHFNKKITIPNTGLGGIHPLEALDSHHANLAKLIAESLDYLPKPDPNTAAHKIVNHNGSARCKPDFITATRGPGMRNNLSCGLDTAKGLAVAWQVPFVGAHHMQAHTLTPRLVHAMNCDRENYKQDAPEFPFLTLLVSGGHTMLVHSTGLTEHQVLATTADTAIGDSLDKCGRLIVPPEIQEAAQDTAFAKYLSQFAFPSAKDFESYQIPATRAAEIQKPDNEFGWQIQTPLSDTKKLAFSFAGITSRADSIFARRIQSCQGHLSAAERMCFARTVMGTACEHLGSRTVIALEALRARKVEISSLVVSGGVAANDFLRYFLRAMLDLRGFPDVRLIFPPVALCTDNAAMIAWCGMEMYEAGYRSDLNVRSLRKWSMDPKHEDGGILGVGGWLKTHQPAEV